MYLCIYVYTVNKFMYMCHSIDLLSAEILEAPAKPSDTKSLIKAKLMFAQCMDKGMCHYNAKSTVIIMNAFTKTN